ncbi:phage tail protein, partial [Mycobacteroides abscessus]
YTVPESAFTDFTGLATRQTIGSFIIPPMPFDYVPVVHGHFKANGIELDADPFIIGSEVRIGNATSGQLIAKGAGNMSSWSALFPHASSTGSPNTAITPDNGIGMIPAYSTGTTSTLYVNLVNEGMAGFYSFNKAGAQLSILIVPVSPLKPEDGS